MELTIKDRLLIPMLFPEKGTFNEFNLKKDISKKLYISEEEKKELNFREERDTGLLKWDNEKDVPLSVDFSSDELEFLKNVCESKQEESLSDEMWQTVEKIYNSIQ